MQGITVIIEDNKKNAVAPALCNSSIADYGASAEVPVLSELYQTKGIFVKYYPDMALYLGSHNAAILYQRIYDLRDKGKRPDGFIYKSAKELTTETGLSEKEQRNARKLLIERGWLETKKHRANGAPTIHYRPLMGIVHKSIRNVPKGQTRNGQTPIQNQPKGRITNTISPLDYTLDRNRIAKSKGF